MNEGSYLFQDSFLAVNKKLLRHLEGNAVQAVIFTELASLSRAFKETDQMKYHDDWFFRSVEDLERDTCISYHKQRVAIEKLEERGFLQTKIAGRPGKRFFKICHDVVEQTLYGKVSTPITIDAAQLSKKDKQEKYYKELNTAASLDFDTFKSKIDNMKKPFAVLIYTWGKLYNHYSGKNWEWSPITLGKLRYWYNAQAPEGQIDYSRLCEFFKDRLPINITPEKYIDSWISYDKSNFEKPLEQRVYDPRGYWNEHRKTSSQVL